MVESLWVVPKEDLLRDEIPNEDLLRDEVVCRKPRSAPGHHVERAGWSWPQAADTETKTVTMDGSGTELRTGPPQMTTR